MERTPGCREDCPSFLPLASPTRRLNARSCVDGAGVTEDTNGGTLLGLSLGVSVVPMSYCVLNGELVTP